MVPINGTVNRTRKAPVSRPRPTHRARHLNGWEVAIYIAPSLQEQLHSRLPRQRHDAESSVAIRFKEACKRKFPGFNVGHIYFNDLLLTPLSDAAEEEPPTSAVQYCTCPDDNCPYCSGDNGRSHRDCPRCALDT